jgi:hypothetical protein
LELPKITAELSFLREVQFFRQVMIALIGPGSTASFMAAGVQADGTNPLWRAR